MSSPLRSTRHIERYAPSPSGDLHLGNLRTAMITWLHAHAAGGTMLLRIDDIDAQRSSEAAAQRQLQDLRSIGLTWEDGVTRQQARLARYQEVLDSLMARGLVYECYCSRQDILDAQRAPHGIPGSYPGTCRDLPESERAARRAVLAEGGARGGRVPALRLRADVTSWAVQECFAHSNFQGEGPQAFVGEVDDFVLRRGGNILPGSDLAGEPGVDRSGTERSGTDGADLRLLHGGHGADFSYNLTVVVDDADTGVTHVTRGDDLLASSPRQAYLAHLLGFPPVQYVHVPLVLGRDGRRLAKRDGAVTLAELCQEAGTVTALYRTVNWLVGSIFPKSQAEAILAQGGHLDAAWNEEQVVARNQRVMQEGARHFNLRAVPAEPVTFPFVDLDGLAP